MVPAHTDGPMPEGTTMTSVTEPSYSHGASAVPLLGETIGANLRRIAARHPGREAVVDVPTGQRWTYARLDAGTDALARGLIGAGIEAGARVGIWAHTRMNHSRWPAGRWPRNGYWEGPMNPGR